MRNYIFPTLIFFFVLATFFYGYIFKECEYTVILDGTTVNFSGIDDFIPPFINIVADLFVAPDFKIVSCGIRKSMAQLTTNTMCLLYDQKSFLEGNHSFNETWKSDRSCHKEDPNFRRPSEEVLSDEETVRFAFIRDPFDRFVSLYLDKCLRDNLCWSCGSDMRCVVRQIYLGLKTIQNDRDGDLAPTFMDLHAAPLSWNCNFDKELSKWHLLMMGPDSEQRKSAILHVANILKRQGVSKDIVRKVQTEIKGGETLHSTHKSSMRTEAERQVREDPVVRDYLHKIYFYDYLVFPFNREPLDAKYQTDFWKL